MRMREIKPQEDGVRVLLGTNGGAEVRMIVEIRYGVGVKRVNVTIPIEHIAQVLVDGRTIEARKG